MTKLTLTVVGENDDAAIHLMLRAYKQLLLSDQPLREGRDSYTVSFMEGNASCDVARFTSVCASEDEVNRLARAFTAHVRAFFVEGDDVGGMFATVLERNRAEENPTICHTHDFCDANILMSNAWEETFPHEPFSPQNTFHAELWSEAWQQAKAAEFQLPNQSPAA
jgi:hypothetical protein